MHRHRHIVTAPVLVAIVALAVHLVLVPPMSFGAGWAALCSPDGVRTVISVGGTPAPGGLGDCDDCPVCPPFHGTTDPNSAVSKAFDRRHAERAPIRWFQTENDHRSAVLAVPVGRRAPPIA